MATQKLTVKDGIPCREWLLPDGTVIDTTRSGRCAGPGVGGQHFGTSYIYYRINGGEWLRPGFATRCEQTLFQWIDLCETLARRPVMVPEAIRAGRRKGSVRPRPCRSRGSRRTKPLADRRGLRQSLLRCRRRLRLRTTPIRLLLRSPTTTNHRQIPPPRSRWTAPIRLAHTTERRESTNCA